MIDVRQRIAREFRIYYRPDDLYNLSCTHLLAPQMSLFSSLLSTVLYRRRSADDLGNFLRNSRLPCLVIFQRKLLDKLTGVV